MRRRIEAFSVFHPRGIAWLGNEMNVVGNNMIPVYSANGILWPKSHK